MTRQRLSRMNARFLALCLTLMMGAPTALGQGVPAGGSVSAPVGTAADGVDPRIGEQLAAAKRQVNVRGPQIQEELLKVADALKETQAFLRDKQTPELLARRQELKLKQSVLKAELKALQEIASTWQGAFDSSQDLQRYRKELDDFQFALKRGLVKFQPGDSVVLEATVQQCRSALRSSGEQQAARQKSAQTLDETLSKPDVSRRSILDAQRRVLAAQLETAPVRRAASETRLAFHEARLQAARKLGEVAESQPSTQSQSSTSSAAAALEAKNKEKLAKELELEARDAVAWARERVAETRQDRAAAIRNGQDTTSLDHDLQLWNEREQYEVRRLRQATMKRREAEQKQQILELEEEIRDSRSQLDKFKTGRTRLTQEQRKLMADQLREEAAAVAEEANGLERDAALSLNWIASVQETLPIIDATENGIQQQLRSSVSPDDSQRLRMHYQRMKLIFDSERQQIDQMVTSQTVGYYQLMRQATLKRQLADVYRRMADVLVPPEPSFYELYKRVFHALGIFILTIVAAYATKLLVWLTEVIAGWLRAAIPSYNFSVKRVATLAGFAGSIARLFIWIFGIITILYEFGIDPATSSGAIGLVGLIMAGMFQQIVVDFIKGLDIIAGRHYNVGDFIEVDSKFGHVVDFDVKYTRIRTLSGQEVNIPNSRCIPSRRFPEGYVDNYVDIMLESGADASEAKAAISPVGFHLNRRLEPIKERPQFIDRFRSTAGRSILRYRVRVLPGCDWVITDYFIPAVRTALEARGIKMEGEPKFFFINRIETFRKLFSRQLTEQEIIEQKVETEAPPTPPSHNGNSSHPAAVSSDKPPPPPDSDRVSEKPPVPDELDERNEYESSGAKD